MELTSIDGFTRAVDGAQSPSTATRSALTAIASGLQLLRTFTVTLLLAAPLAPAAAQELQWVRQMGTAGYDWANGVAVDNAGNVYITGMVAGITADGPGFGSGYIFLAKYTAAGEVLWTRQIGAGTGDGARGVAVDGAGNVYITGLAAGDLAGPAAGGGDIFVAKYDAMGTQLWIRQTGTSAYDDATGVAVDGAGNAYICGNTFGDLGGPIAGDGSQRDVFLAKYDASGALLWIRQTGRTGPDEATGVAVDRTGNAYITGTTYGSLGGPLIGGTDFFLLKYDSQGILLWSRQNGGPSYEDARGVAVDSAGSAYVTGLTVGSFARPNPVGMDYFLAKYDAVGTLLWVRQAGETYSDGASAVAISEEGDVVIAGATIGEAGWANLFRSDTLLAKYSASGSRIWQRAARSGMSAPVWGLAVDQQGSIYTVGYTESDYGGTNAGGTDMFLARYGPLRCVSPADIAGGDPLGNMPDGTVDGTDFITFIDSFAFGDAPIDPRADIAGGGDTGLEPDGTIDGTDFIAFINAFAIGC